MAVTITTTQGTSVMVHSTESNSITITGNDSVSNIASTGEIVSGASIRQVWCGCGNDVYWVVERGNSSQNSVIVVVNGTSYIDFTAGGGVPKIEETGEDLYFTLNGTGDGFIQIQLAKQSGK